MRADELCSSISDGCFDMERLHIESDNTSVGSNPNICSVAGHPAVRHFIGSWRYTRSAIASLCVG